MKSAHGNDGLGGLGVVPSPLSQVRYGWVWVVVVLVSVGG